MWLELKRAQLELAVKLDRALDVQGPMGQPGGLDEHEISMELMDMELEVMTLHNFITNEKKKSDKLQKLLERGRKQEKERLRLQRIHNSMGGGGGGGGPLRRVGTVVGGGFSNDFESRRGHAPSGAAGLFARAPPRRGSLATGSRQSSSPTNK